MSKSQLILLLIPFLVIQGIWLFKDARKRNAMAWLWGIWGLLQLPAPAIVYYFVVVRKSKREERSRWIQK